MPITADRERELLNKYKLTSLYPERWPTRADESSGEDSDGEAAHQQNGSTPTRMPSKVSDNPRSSVARYRNIDRHASLRSSAAATDSESVVQKDEADALGMAPSVASELKRRGVPIDDNLKLRNRFMLSSTTFAPAAFLATVHQDATTDDLLRGLDHLSQSIEQKSASLKVLVESNFEKFVKAKATIDNVYTEMRSQCGAVSDSPSQRRPHSRQTSKGQSHFRSASGRMSIGKTPAAPLSESKKKHALIKESEYGVQGIKAPLLDVAVRAEEVWGPALGGQEKEETMKEVVSSLDQHRDIFHLSGDIHESIKKNDYDNVVAGYKHAKKYADAARNIADIAKAHRGELSDSDARQIIVTAKMWHDVESQITIYKSDVLRRLRDSHRRRAAGITDDSDKEEHMELIGVLIQLGVDENPIWQWLNSRYLYLRDKIARTFERARVELEVLRRTLANHPKTDPLVLAKYLRAAASNADTVRLIKGTDRDIDSPAIIAFWEKMLSSFTMLLSMKTGVLGEVIEYWETAQSFIDNKAQKAFPYAVVMAGQEHLELEPDDVQNLRSGALELVQTIRENISAFFSDPPVEDLSELYSPIPSTPKSPETSSTLSPGAKRAFSFDPASLPPASPKRGDAWEKFAFWPPQANSVSGSQYLGRLLVLVGVGASELAALNIVKQSSGGVETFRSLVGTVRERCVQAVCAAWDADAERCRLLETWTRQPERRDLTTMPASLAIFEEKVVANIQKIAYITDGLSARSSAEVVVPPSAKLLQALRGAFVTSLYKALSGMVENAEKTRSGALVNADPDGVTVPRSAAADGDNVSVAIDANNRNIRMLLTLSNLSHLRSEIIPHLLSQFETNFSLKLSDESKTIRDVGGQIDARLFQSYVSPTVTALQTLISTSITSPTWEPTSPPTDAKPYIYDILLRLVLIHSEVSSTAPTLTNQILSYLLEQSSTALISAFKKRPRYSLPALMQATLDVEFLAQTLNNYTTDKAGETQSQIYLALDERTDNESRALLQAELPNMRAVLKKLREGTRGQFGCFRRERRGRGERAGSGGGRHHAVGAAA